jgi:membrane associated rhomboid family serine protease
MSNFFTNLSYKYKAGTSLMRLIFINIGIFVFIRMAFIVLQLFNLSGYSFLSYIEMPASWSTFLRQPWAIVTYMFLHYDFFHLFFNMLCLYWFGKIFLEHFTQKQLVGVYLLGGIGGAVIYAAAYNIFPAFGSKVALSYLLGASAAVMAIVVAAAVIAPNYTIRLFLIGSVKLKYIAIVTVLLSFFGTTSSNAGGEFAHLGGALLGYVYAVLLNKGNDLTRPVTVVINWFANIFKPKPKIRKTKFSKRAKSDAEYNYEKKQAEKNIDKILDKIKKSGYSSLTNDEKQQLFDQSKKI